MTDPMQKAVEDPCYTPNQLERDAEALMASLTSQRDAEMDKRKRKQLTARLKSARIMRDWARTRAGYRAEQ